MPDADQTAQLCVGEGFINHECMPQPTAPVVFPSGTLNTMDTNCHFTRTIGSGPKLCFLVYTQITFQGVLRVHGPNPVVFVGRDGIVVQSGAVLDAASHTGLVDPGPGAALDLDCTMSNLLDGSSGGEAGGGGAGGTFRTRGGDGGAGFVATGTTPPGIATGPIVAVNAVRGGCAAGAGGASGSGTGGGGGRGGGAIYLVSNGSIQILGAINASGAGGAAGGAQYGGSGGGGSGGFIGLDAPLYSFGGAKVFAIGGSGAAGAGAARAGVAGKEATGPLGPGQTSTTSGGGNGGGGAATLDGESGVTASSGGGGGGGGGKGFIGITNVPQLPASTFAPVPTPMN